MPKHSITLDLLKEIQVIPEEVEVRVGEANSQTIEAALTEKGLPYKVPAGEWSATITLLTAAKNTKTQLASISEDRKALSVTLADEMLTDEGTCGLAYFKLTGPDGEILTTEGFILRIQGSTITSENGQSWDQEIADLKQSFALEIEKIREDEKTRVENELIRIAQEAAREAAEALRKSAESSRDAAEGERASAEEGRDAAEQKRDAAEKLRASEEGKRAAAEKLRETAEGKRAAAEDARVSSERARDAAERVRETQESTREENEAARKRAEADRVAAEGTRATQEAERVSAEDKRAADFTASQDANAKAFAASEQARQETFETAEGKRAEGETEREEAEGKRTAAEGLRDAAETARKQAEADRVAAETARDAAEKLRAQAEELRTEAEKLRVEAEIAREAAQAKNNADQAANNQAAQGRLTRILVEGEYDPETGVPTIEGDLTHVFAVPNADYETARADLEEAEAAHEAAVAKLRSVERKMGDATGDGPTYDGQVELAQASLDLSAAALEKAQATFEAKNKYVEWLWLFDNEGVGFWEQYGTGSQILPDPVTSEEIDRMWAGEPVESNHLVYTTGLNYDVQKAQAALSAHATAQKATDSAQDTSIAAAQAAADAAQAAAESAKSTAASELADAVAAQATKDSTQDTAIAAARKAGDDAASALAAYKTAQATTDSEQDEAIKQAQETADAAKSAIPPTVTSEAGGILPAFPAAGGPLYAVVKDGELIGWQAIPVYDTTQAGLVPVAPPEDGGVKVLLNTGWGEYKGGGMPDSRPLKASIAAAEKDKTETKVQGGGDYDFGTNVTTQAELDKLTQAIAAAQAVLDSYDDPNTTQAMLDAAKATLDQAVSAFEGTLSPLQPDKSQLTALEKRYDDLKKDVVVSTDGKDVPFGSKWTTSAEKLAADTALQAAQTSVEAATKQSQIKSACDTLDTALDTYESARKTATKDTAALDRAITAANDAKQDVLTSDSEGSDLPSGSQYVTSAQMKALTDALSAATGAKESASTQAAIDKAASDLTSATSTFQSQVKTNWSAPDDIADASWDDIAKTSELAAADPQSYSKYLGQTKTIQLTGISGVTDVTVKIIGVGQDVDTTGAKVGFTFQLTDGLKYDRPVNMQMNSSNTTSGGWQSCLMRSTNLPKIKDALPAELKAKLKKVKKKTNMTGSGTATVETEDDLFLLSFKEVFGDAQGYASDGSHNWLKEEGEWYQWYQQHNTNADRVIKQAGGSAYGWWLRSVYSSSSFCRVNISGAWGYDYANNDYLPCAGLCI